MAFVDKRLLTASEVCLQWVTIGSTTYLSVSNTSAGYYRVYRSNNGGPLTQILNKNSSSGTAYYIFKVGSTLYAGHTTTTATWNVLQYSGSGTSWDSAGYLNGAQQVVCRRDYNGGVYFLLTGYDSSTQHGRTLLVQFGTGTFNNFTTIKDSANGGLGGKWFPSFDINPATGFFYIMEQDEGLGPGNLSIYVKNGATETTLISWGSGVEGLDLNIIDGVLYLLRTTGSGTFHVFSRLSDLSPSATETIIDNTTISNGSSTANFRRSVRSAVLHDLLIVSYARSGGTYGFFTYNTTDEVVEVLANYSGALSFDKYGDFEVSGDEAIFGVLGKFIVFIHQAPDDEDPPPPEPEPIEDLTEEILIEVRPAPCNPITVCWLNSLGVYETFCFEDLNGIFETEYKTRIEAEYERYIEDLETDTNTTGITAKTVERSLKLGADNIDADVYVGLIDLFTSPAVFMLVSEDPIKWLPVRVSPGSIKYSEHDHALEITLELPNMFVQRS